LIQPPYDPAARIWYLEFNFLRKTFKGIDKTEQQSIPKTLSQDNCPPYQTDLNHTVQGHHLKQKCLSQMMKLW